MTSRTTLLVLSLTACADGPTGAAGSSSSDTGAATTTSDGTTHDGTSSGGDTTIASSEATTTHASETSGHDTTTTTDDTTGTTDGGGTDESSTGEVLACGEAPGPAVGLLDDAWSVGPRGSPVAITATASGDVIVAGDQSDLDFGGSSIGPESSFVAKYGADLELAWVREIGNDYVTRVAVDEASGEVTVTQHGAVTRLDGATGDPLWQVSMGGQVRAVAPLDGGDVVVTWGQGNHGRIARLEAEDGDVVWQQTVVASMGFADFSIPRGLAPTDDGFVWAGQFFGTIATARGDFASVPAMENTGLVRYDGDGNAQWAYAMISTGPVAALEVGADPCGVYLSGRAITPLDIGDVEPLTTNDDLFLVRVDIDGVVQWGREYGYSVASSGRLDVDADGNVLLVGDGYGGAFGAFALPFDGERQAYLAKIGSDGEPLWAHGFVGTWSVLGIAAAFDGDGNAWVTGRFNAPDVDVGGEVLGGAMFEIPMYVARFQP